MTKKKNSNTKLLIVDDHKMFVEGLVSFLKEEPDLEILDTCFSAKEFLPVKGFVLQIFAFVMHFQKLESTDNTFKDF